MIDHPRVLTTVVEEQEDGLMVIEIVSGRMGINRGCCGVCQGAESLNGQRDF